VRHPIRHTGAGSSSKGYDPAKVSDWHDSRHDGLSDAGSDYAIPESEERVRIEKKLGDRTGRTGIQFAFQVVKVGMTSGNLGMILGIGRHRDVKRTIPPKVRNETWRICITSGMRVPETGSEGQIAPKCDEAANTKLDPPL